MRCGAVAGGGGWRLLGLHGGEMVSADLIGWCMLSKVGWAYSIQLGTLDIDRVKWKSMNINRVEKRVLCQVRDIRKYLISRYFSSLKGDRYSCH